MNQVSHEIAGIRSRLALQAHGTKGGFSIFGLDKKEWEAM
jgi:hypothetical protein